MAPPTVSETPYGDNNFSFNPIEYPKDEYIQYDANHRLLSKFNSNNMQNSDEIYFSKVYSFILQNIISKYDELTSCTMLHEDMEGNPNIIFNIKFNGDLSFSKRNALHTTILEEICQFCDSSNFPFIFDDISLLLVKGANQNVW